MKVASLADVLSSLLPPPLEPSPNGQSAYHDQTMLDIGGVHKPKLQAMVFQMLIIEVSEGLLKTRQEVRAALKALIVWMSLFPGSITLGYLVSAMLGMTIAQETLAQASTKGSLTSQQLFSKSKGALTSLVRLEEAVWTCAYPIDQSTHANKHASCDHFRLLAKAVRSHR